MIADQNRLLREMLTKAINTEQDLEIVRILNSHHHLYEQVQNNDIDWVIMSWPDEEETLPDDVRKILADFPSVGVLIVSPDGSHVRAKWLKVHERILDGIGLNELIELLSARAIFETASG
ncbi:MAG TPA: hypothetical protein VJ965_00590 [Anaerolineales bacterium]|nr:hypothetical protein [Anaerolineales bacterium]